jgi:hypothetical protein
LGLVAELLSPEKPEAVQAYLFDGRLLEHILALFSVPELPLSVFVDIILVVKVCTFFEDDVVQKVMSTGILQAVDQKCTELGFATDQDHRQMSSKKHEYRLRVIHRLCNIVYNLAGLEQLHLLDYSCIINTIFHAVFYCASRSIHIEAIEAFCQMVYAVENASHLNRLLDSGCIQMLIKQLSLAAYTEYGADDTGLTITILKCLQTLLTLSNVGPMPECLPMNRCAMLIEDCDGIAVIDALRTNNVASPIFEISTQILEEYFVDNDAAAEEDVNGAENGGLE